MYEEAYSTGKYFVSGIDDQRSRPLCLRPQKPMGVDEILDLCVDLFAVPQVQAFGFSLSFFVFFADTPIVLQDPQHGPGKLLETGDKTLETWPII